MSTSAAQTCKYVSESLPLTDGTLALLLVSSKVSHSKPAAQDAQVLVAIANLKELVQVASLPKGPGHPGPHAFHWHVQVRGYLCHWQ